MATSYNMGFKVPLHCTQICESEPSLAKAHQLRKRYNQYSKKIRTRLKELRLFCDFLGWKLKFFDRLLI